MLKADSENRTIIKSHLKNILNDFKAGRLSQNDAQMATVDNMEDVVEPDDLLYMYPGNDFLNFKTDDGLELETIKKRLIHVNYENVDPALALIKVDRLLSNNKGNLIYYDTFKIVTDREFMKLLNYYIKTINNF